MSAIPTHLTPPLSTERRTDPSMEEILASIRKIIADEDSAPSRAAPPVASPRSQEPQEDQAPIAAAPSGPLGARLPGQPPIGLSRPSAAPVPFPPRTSAPIAPPLRPSFESALNRHPTSNSTASQPVAAPPPAAAVAPRPAAPISLPQEPPASSIEAPEAAAPFVPMPEPETAVAEREVIPLADRPIDVGALVSTATTESITSAFQALSASVALTKAEVVDRHVRDLLRPMLRTWLDDNLPTIVEKLVRAEIERVARGGR